MHSTTVRSASLPNPTAGVYWQLNLFSLCVITAVLFLIVPRSESVFMFWTWFAIILAFSTRGHIRERSPEVPANVREFLTKIVGNSLDEVQLRATSVNDFFARSHFGSKTCFIPSKVIAQLENPDNLSSTKVDELGAIVAHEVGHLLTGDSKHFEHSLVLMACAGASVFWLFVLLWPLIASNSTGIIKAVFGSAAIVFVHFFLLAAAMRSREFTADSLSCYITGAPHIGTFLTRMARREAFTTYSLGYRLTHPTFRERLNIHANFYCSYRYEFKGAAIFGILFALISMGSAAVVTGERLMLNSGMSILIAATFQIAVYYAIFISLIPRIVVSELNITQLSFRAIEMYVVQVGFVFLVATVIFGADPIAMFYSPTFEMPNGELANDLLAESFAHTPLWAKLITPAVMLVVFHIGAFLGVRRILCFRGQKNIGRFFYVKGTVSLLFASAVVNAMLITLFQVEESELAESCVIALTSIFVAIIPWMLTIQTVVKGTTLTKDAQFVQAEWPVWKKEDIGKGRALGCLAFALLPFGMAIVSMVFRNYSMEGLVGGFLAGLLIAAINLPGFWKKN